ncbi:MAG: hypothetical protein ABR907_10060 [Terracidiphilus sp.]|jgi:hypothetical protein
MKSPSFFLLAAAGTIFFTSSFDIFLNINLGPNIRVAQLFALLLLAAALLTHRLGKSMEIPLGSMYLLAWCAIQLAFVPVSVYWQKSLAYFIWLALDIALSFAMVNLFAFDPRRLRSLLNLYLYSYVFIAVFGIIQFIFPILGGPALLVEQWWLPGRVPRVNGFSYEPSYYATYLIMGQVCLGSLRRSRLAQFRQRKWSFSYFLIVLALMICFSRMGVIFSLLEISITPLTRLWTFVKHPRLILGLCVSGRKMLVTTAVLLIAYSAVNSAFRWFFDDPETAQILVSGTGLLGTAAHSVDEREERFQDTLHIIASNPWMGQSLGGITDSIASYYGVRPQNFEESKLYEGQSVFAEVIASSGIPGSIPFLCFLIVTVVSPLRLATRFSPLFAAWLRALVLALVFEWAILQLNQNILRLYLWVHIALLVTVFAAARRQYTEPGDADFEEAGYGSPNLLA